MTDTEKWVQYPMEVSDATYLLQQKANIRCVQDILGHKSLDTTQKYTQITITDLKEAHSKCHPREKEKIF